MDEAAKDARQLVNNAAATTTKSKAVVSTASSTTTVESTIKIGEDTFALQAARTIWSTREQMDLIWSYKIWKEKAKLSQSKKLIPISKLWSEHIPI